MYRIISILLLLIPLLAYSQDEFSTIRKEGDNVFISSKIDNNHEINYWFKRCMANDLFTFYRVSISSDSADTKIVNEAYSDNIGPFEIEGGGWCGGNHLFMDEKTKTAETFSINLYGDGMLISSDTTLKVRNVMIEVQNYIYNPISAVEKDDKILFTDTLCIEKVTYIVQRNNIQVNLSHDYTNSIPVTVLKYYGMQSMFKGESHLLTPLGEYIYWTPIDKVDRFKKTDFPQFNRYIEKNEFSYQASFLFNKDLGTHNQLPADDMIFVGNSWSKCYHKLIGNAHKRMGDHDGWSGVYTWIAVPSLNTESAFAYDGIIDGKSAIFFSNNVKGNFTIPIPDSLKNSNINIIENRIDIKIKKKSGILYLQCHLPGSAIIMFE